MKNDSKDSLDRENPEWTRADFESARPGHEVLPPGAIASWTKRRGRQIAPTKQQITLRLSPDVVAGFRATGPGWQSRIDAALKAHLGL